jgi:hypothetical protein
MALRSHTYAIRLAVEGGGQVKGELITVAQSGKQSLKRSRPRRAGHQNGGPFFGRGRESDEGDAGVQSIGSAVVDVAPGDYFELVARQTSAATKNVAADELTWFAIEVVE